MPAAKKTVKPKRAYLNFGGVPTAHFSVTTSKVLLARINAAAKAAGWTRSRWLIEVAQAALPAIVKPKKK